MTSDSVWIDPSLECLNIAIRKMRIVRDMAQLIPFADTKEDIRFVLETMQNEIEEGNEQINQITGEQDDKSRKMECPH